jgi:hypothetical protein
MKIIIDTATGNDNITVLAASSSDVNFPAANLLNNYPTDLWKAAAGVLIAELVLSVSKGSAVEVYNTNATSVTVEAGSGGTYAFETGYSLEADYSLEDSASYVTTVYSLPGTWGRLWADYPVISTPHVIKITLTAASEVSAGIVRAGNVETFNDPAYGFTEDSKDYSVEKELNNGADYFRKGNVVRTFSGMTVLETRANCFKFKHDIFDAVGPKPLAIRLSSGTILDDEFVLFAKRMDSPKILHDSSPLYSRLKFSLKEVV